MLEDATYFYTVRRKSDGVTVIRDIVNAPDSVRAYLKAQEIVDGINTEGLPLNSVTNDLVVIDVLFPLTFWYPEIDGEHNG